MILLVAYDIRSDARRSKVAQALIRLGARVQYSVFIVERRTPREIEEAILSHLDIAEDDVRIHCICGSCEAASLHLGRARPRDRRAYRVI